MDEQSDRVDQRTDELAELVLRHVLDPNYHPVKPRVIAKQMGLPKERYAEVKQAVKRLTKQGRLAYGRPWGA